ncbi:integrin alpha-IIb isoform X1 [Babesia caballi]|uniref:Integrin alpha-IIb isoform X1 n=1 Tax=Babesia caballi TaxID=5871 RepID=A0AAV4LTQ1_BABCB|nr:integrin alpha-IIb isoform X1 [Babesia caballi]
MELSGEEGARRNPRLADAEPHGPALGVLPNELRHGDDRLPVLRSVDHLAVHRLRHELVHDVKHRQLQAEADAEEGYIVEPAVADGAHLADGPALAEAARHHHRRDALELLRYRGGVGLQAFGLHKHNLEGVPGVHGGVLERVYDGEVGVVGGAILADERHGHRDVVAAHQPAPAG